MLTGKKILLGITGSIAAYKATALTRLLVKAGAEVKIVMTDAAKEFVTPLSLSTLSKSPVLSGLTKNDNWANHVMLGRWADILLIAPLSCNTLAKMANGNCDNLLLATFLSATCPVVAAPAMDEDMWHHFTTRSNLEKISNAGIHILPVETGELASGLNGEGRMAEPETILNWLERYFSERAELRGKYVLVTAGPTYEMIDPVRFIGNQSSGKMGVAIAEEMYNRGAKVTLVLGPSGIDPIGGVETIRVKSSEEMFEACISNFDRTDIAVLSAAVADFTPVAIAREKIKKSSDEMNLQLKKTKDILQHLGATKKNGQVLVGFALETENEKANALKKLETKNADLIVLNSLRDEGVGFSLDTNKITIFGKGGSEYHFETKSKKAVAVDIVNTIIQYMHA